MPDQGRIRPLHPVLLGLAATAVLACGGGRQSVAEAERTALAALAAYDAGDAPRICRLLSEAEQEGTRAAGGCVPAYRELFANRAQQDEIDRAIQVPLRPGPVIDTERDGDEVIVTVRAAARTLTRGQRRELVRRYGPTAPEGLRARDMRVRVAEQDGQLVVSF